MLINRRKRT